MKGYELNLNNIINVLNNVLENELKYQDTVILKYRIEYPQFESTYYKMTIQRINKFYENKALEYQQFCENEFFNLAKEQYIGGIQQGFPVRVFEAMLTYNVTYSSNCIISLYFDKYEFDGGAHGRTLRDSESWNLQNNSLLKLEQLINCSEVYQSYIFENIIKEIQTEPEVYFPDYENLVKQTFDSESFYCTYEGIVVYFQQYDIAPYVSGIRGFLLIYSECVKDPGTMCRAINKYM